MSNKIEITGYITFFNSQSHTDPKTGEEITYINASVLSKPAYAIGRKEIPYEPFKVAFTGKTAEFIQKEGISNNDLVKVLGTPRMDSWKDSEQKTHHNFRIIGGRIELKKKGEEKKDDLEGKSPEELKAIIAKLKSGN